MGRKRKDDGQNDELENEETKKEQPLDKEKEKSINDIINSINKRWGKDSVNYLGNKEIPPIPVVTTHSRELDKALGGGYPEGKIIEIFGTEASGKSTLTLHAIAEWQKKYPTGLVGLVDTENSFDPNYAKSLGVRVSELIVSQPEDGTKALNITMDMAQMGVKLIIVDSVAALVPAGEAADDNVSDTSGGMAEQARLMSKALRKLNSVIGATGTTVIFTNQLRSKIGVMFGEKTTTPGGMALRFYSSVRIKLATMGTEKLNGVPVLSKVIAKIAKNKIAPPFREANFLIRFGEGISEMDSIIDYAIGYGILVKSGGRYSHKDEVLVNGKDKLYNFFKENSELYATIKEEVEEKIKSGVKLPTKEKGEKEEDNSELKEKIKEKLKEKDEEKTEDGEEGETDVAEV